MQIKPITICPQCRGTKKDFNNRHRRLMKCELCEGRGWVPMQSCKGCGRPAFVWWPNARQLPFIRYCGRVECLDVLVKIHNKPVSAGKASWQRELEARRLMC